ncbi:hypothetical protein BDL97_08G145200 [Sphagnum fallax]|nr:hypothetical protein BDL97_08G145200 [Sphagnum fallax]
MKFLEYTPLARMNAFLASVNIGGCLVQGVLEAYSCKVAGIDKKLSRSLEQEVVDSLAVSPKLSTSPVGPLSTTASMLRPHHFSKEHGILVAKQKIDQYLVEASKVWSTELGEDIPLIECIWTAIDEVMNLEDCDVYSYVPDAEADPFANVGSIWSFNYFFYNKKMKRILYFSSRCLSKMSSEESSSDDGTNEWGLDFVEGMDLED